jgi:hypothetical protein
MRSCRLQIEFGTAVTAGLAHGIELVIVFSPALGDWRQLLLQVGDNYLALLQV